MADITTEAKRVKAGQSLTDMNNQGTNAVNQLKAIKINLAALSTTMQADADFTQADIDALTAIVTALATEIGTILA